MSVAPALSLTGAAVWAGEYQLSTEDAEGHKDAGRRLWGRWTFIGQPQPRYIVCLYGSGSKRYLNPQVIIPVPVGGEPCELDIQGRNRDLTLWDVRGLACHGSAMKEPKIYFPVRPSRTTELGGMSLDMPRAALKGSVLARGGTITAEDDAHLHLTVNNDRFIVHFPPNGDRPDEIAALLPPRKGQSLDTFFEVVLRFGTPDPYYPYPDHHWEGWDDVWVVYHPGGIDSGEPQELRLMDHEPPSRRP
ncbi:MAG: hypothetical protein HY985_01595 [Magnetospirillum sp.]|nr:hypothetical protein [Magnetospirillum sp.]